MTVLTGDIFDCHNLRWGCYWPGMLLSILQCKGQCLTTIYVAPNANGAQAEKPSTTGTNLRSTV